MYYTTENFEVDYYKGWLVIHDTATKQNECVQLKNDKGRNITLNQFKSGVKTHGVDRACRVFLKLAATCKPSSHYCY